jgi:hypothetical protein
MNNNLIAVLFGMMIAVVGCRTTTVTPASTSTGKKMNRGAKIYITTPRDGSYGREKYPGSGSEVATALEAAFAPYAEDVMVGEQKESTSDAIEVARLKKCQYLVIPKIAQWEERATEWSGKRDKLGLFIRVISVVEGTEVTSAEISGKSSWFTFGGDHPQDLLRSPTREFVGSLF